MIFLLFNGDDLLKKVLHFILWALVFLNETLVNQFYKEFYKIKSNVFNEKVFPIPKGNSF